MVRNCQPLTQPPSWRATPFWLSATAYSIYSKLLSISGDITAIQHILRAWSLLPDPFSVLRSNHPKELRLKQNICVMLKVKINLSPCSIKYHTMKTIYA
jgi:hypothetical protein